MRPINAYFINLNQNKMKKEKKDFLHSKTLTILLVAIVTTFLTMIIYSLHNL